MVLVLLAVYVMIGLLVCAMLSQGDVPITIDVVFTCILGWPVVLWMIAVTYAVHR